MDQFAPLLLANALLLGFRHGFDWDHLAAICDIVGTAGGGGSARSLEKQRSAVWLATIYALGHACVCLLLGFIALFFNLLAPPWLDKIMEVLVGFTLLVLGTWLLFSLKNNDAAPKSSGMLVLGLLNKWWDSVCHRFGHLKHSHAPMESYGPKTCFGIGVIHGIGAETATQILMIAAIGGATTRMAGMSMLFAFVFGLFAANLLLSLLAAGGFLVSAHVKKLFLFTAALTGVFSIGVGATFVCGASSFLPEIMKSPPGVAGK